MANPLWSYEGNDPHFPTRITLVGADLVCDGCGAHVVDHYWVGENVPDRLELAVTVPFYLNTMRREAIGGYSKAEEFGVDPDDIAAVEQIGRTTFNGATVNTSWKMTPEVPLSRILPSEIDYDD